MTTGGPCDTFEINLERRAHGAVEGDEAAALDAHLAGCERCRGFAALVSETEARLRSEAGEAATDLPWAAIEQRMDERARQARRSRWLVPAALLGTAALSGALGLPLPGALAMAGLGLITTAIVRWKSGRWLRDLARAEATRGGLLAFSRQQIEDELRATRTGSAALVGLAVVQVLGVELLGHPSWIARLAVVGGAFLLLATAAMLALREAPRLRRELRELS